jgi:gamma-glutamyltranspeptidase/glutathione hydrolase
MNKIFLNRMSVLWALLVSASLLIPAHAMSAPRGASSARHGMVVSADSLASAAGAEVLKQGGNAVDAAVMVGFVLAVTYPEAGNLGGGGFMLIRMADGRATMIDFREKAPAAARKDMYLDPHGNPVPGMSQKGVLAAGVPGTVAGLLTALERYGTRKRSELLSYPLMLAGEGFRVDKRLAESLRRFLPDSLASRSALAVFRPNGVPLDAGETLRQPDLAVTIRAIMDQGADGFYRGSVADHVVSEVRSGGGIMAKEDLTAYRAVERTPLTGSYRGFKIITSAPPAAGGVTLLEMLNILERFDMRGKEHNSAGALHLFASAARCAYADRARYLGDPDFVSMPVDSLIGKAYGRQNAGRIDSVHVTPFGPPTGTQESRQTTHFCTADRFGNVVSTTYTLNDSYGCKTLVASGGFFLNNEMDDFVVKPDVPNMFGLVGGEANAIAPGKRMLSSMTPTIVLKDGKPWLLLGARGGSRISTAVAQVIMNVIDFGLPLQDAVDATRIHYQWHPDELLYERSGLPDDVLDNLRKMGYVVRETADSNGRCHALMVDENQSLYLGAPDPREEGVAIGY